MKFTFWAIEFLNFNSNGKFEFEKSKNTKIKKKIIQNTQKYQIELQNQNKKY